MENNKKPSKESVEKRMAEMKQAMINVLKEMPIIEVAVKRIGISRDTFYRWKLEDKEFEKQSQEAMAQGIDFINDMSESQLVSLIKEKKMPSIRYWLKHNHPRYRERLEITATFKPYEEMNDDQQADFNKAMELASMPEIDIKVDEGFETMSNKKESDTPADEEKPPPEPENMLDENGLLKIIDSKTMPTEPITNPIRVELADRFTTYYPDGEKFVQYKNNGGSMHCPPTNAPSMHKLYEEAAKKKEQKNNNN